MPNFIKTRRERFVEAILTAIFTLALLLGAAWAGERILETEWAAHATRDDQRKAI